MKKILKTVARVIGVCLVVYVAYLIVMGGFHAITHPAVSLKPFNKVIDCDIVSAKQIEILLDNEISQIDKLSKYDLTIGSVDMHIDSEHRGEVSVKYVEKDKDSLTSHIIVAELDTREGMLYTIQDWSRDSKLYPGIISLQEWTIDSTDAVRITEEFFSGEDNFRYDEIWLYSYIDFSGNGKCAWNVFLTDRINNVRYETAIDTYSGEVVLDNIRFF